MNLEEARGIRIEALRLAGVRGAQTEYSGGLRLICLRAGSCVVEVGGGAEALSGEERVAAVVPRGEFYRITALTPAASGVVIELPEPLLLLFQQRGFLYGVRFLQGATRFVCLRAGETSRARVARLLTLFEGCGDDDASLYARLSLCELLILELSRLTGDLAGKDDEASRSQLIKSVIGYVNENYAQDIHLDNIAKKFWINPSYLSREFKEKTGLNLSHFIMEHRVYIAQKLLLTTDRQVAEIAVQVGYKGVSYFGMVFKRISGVSPGEYRSQRRLGR